MGTDELYLYLGKIGDNLNYKSLKCMCFFLHIYLSLQCYILEPMLLIAFNE